MKGEYEVQWRWRKKEYKSVDRLLAKGIDLGIVYFLSIGLMLILYQFIDESLSQFHLRIVICIYLIYEVGMYLLIETTLGKSLFQLTYIAKNQEVKFNQFILRLLSYMVPVIIGIEFGIISVFIVYYFLKILDDISGPYWDHKIKLIGVYNIKEPRDMNLEVRINKPMKRWVIYALSCLFILISIYSTSLNFYGKNGISVNYFNHSIENKIFVFFNEEMDTHDEVIAVSDSVIEKSYRSGQYEHVVELMEQDSITYENASIESLNYYGMALGEIGRGEDAIKVLEDAKRLLGSTDIEMMKSINNNLVWANNKIGDYEKAIAYAKESFELGDDDAYIHGNYADSLFSTYSYEDALSHYLLALDREDAGDFLYTMVGRCYYELNQYEDALIYFNQYLELDSQDIDVISYVGWTKALMDDNYESGLSDMNKVVDIASNPLDGLFQKAEYLSYFGETEESLNIFETLYEEEQSERVVYQLLDIYYNTHSHENAKALVNNYRVNHDVSFDTDFETALMFAYNLYYDEAIDILMKIIDYEMEYEIDSIQWEDALYEVLFNLYDSTYYDEYIALCEKYKDDVETFDLYHFLGIGYVEINEPELAIGNYMKSLEIFEDADYVYEDLIYALGYVNRFEEARQYLEIAISKYPDYYVYSDIHEYINGFMLEPAAKQIFDYIEENYMYFEDSKKYTMIKKKLYDKDQLTEEDYISIETEVFQDDYFSFLIYGEYFKEYMEYEDTDSVHSQMMNEDTIYVKIDMFTMMTDTEFYRVIRDLENTEDKTLIIDVRGNYGGDTDSAFNILDYLLTTRQLGRWDSGEGEDFNYVADGNIIRFKQIYVFTDNESASSSELIALGIKEFTDNGTIVGERTYGKGVGQLAIENQQEEYALFVVNAYWYINEINIHEVGVEPDIYVNDGTLEDYFEAIVP